MFGYATDETEECMPLTLLLAHKINYRMRELSQNKECPWILPDSKSQVNSAEESRSRFFIVYAFFLFFFY